jgi:hypothetical protein
MTREKFEAYLKVQKSGKTNMFDITMVCQLACKRKNLILNRKDCLDIMSNYEEYRIGFESKEINEVFIDDPVKTK